MSHIAHISSLVDLLKRSRRKTLSAPEVHGLITAAVCGPGVIGPARWLPYIFHKTKDFEKLLQAKGTEETLQVLMQLYDDLLFSIRQGTFVPWFGDESTDSPAADDVRPWCTGFLYGMHLHGEAWFGNDSQELANLTAPVFFLANPEEAAAELGEKEARELEGKTDLLVRAISYNVPKVYDFFNLGRDPEEKKNLLPQTSESA